MKLIDLKPHWFAVDGLRCGLIFDCPHCRTTRLAVAFHHHALAEIENAAILARHGAQDVQHIWDLQGQDDFNTLTLSPSIDVSASGHWHGFIIAGNIA